MCRNPLKIIILGMMLNSITFPLIAQEEPDALREYLNGNYEKAVSICLDEIGEYPNNLDSFVVASWSLIALGRYDEAKRYALKARELSRYDPRVIEILGEAAYYQGRNQEALRFFQEYVNLSPEGGRIDMVYYFMGELFIRLGKFQHADIALTTAVRFVDGDALWWTRLGYARENAGDLRNAVQAYEQALALNSQLVEARRGLDRSRNAMGIR